MILIFTVAVCFQIRKCVFKWEREKNVANWLKAVRWYFFPVWLATPISPLWLKVTKVFQTNYSYLLEWISKLSFENIFFGVVNYFPASSCHWYLSTRSIIKYDLGKRARNNPTPWKSSYLDHNLDIHRKGKLNIKRKFVIIKLRSAQSIQHHYPLLYCLTTICETDL